MFRYRDPTVMNFCGIVRSEIIETLISSSSRVNLSKTGEDGLHSSNFLARLSDVEVCHS